MIRFQKNNFRHLLFYLTVFTVACRTESTLDNSEVIYTEYSPPTLLTCVDSIIPHPSGCGMIPVPTDSSSTIQIDMDRNGSFDFNISCSTWYQFVSASGPCANYNSSMNITGIISACEIASESQFQVAKEFLLDEEINNANSWVNYSTLQLNAAGAPFQTDFNGERHIGIRMGSDEGYRYGWILLSKNGFNLSVQSSGLQSCSGKFIRAGQF